MDEYFGKSGDVLTTNGGKTYSCTLNVTNISGGSNSNKFYIMQIILTRTAFVLYTRYGRIGEKGTINQKPYNSEYHVVKEFERIFYSKTKNKFGDGKPFIKYPGRYNLCDVEPEEVIEENINTPPSKLDESVQSLIKDITSKENTEKTIRRYNVDTSKLPLGKISKKQIRDAEKILDNIRKWLAADRESLRMAGIDDPEEFVRYKTEELSGLWWTLIPYACGRSRPACISRESDIENYRELLEILRNIELSGKIFSSKMSLDEIYEDINVDIRVVDKSSDTYTLIENYVESTHGETHTFGLLVTECYELGKIHKNDRDDFFGKTSDHRLLVHGTQTVNYTGILKEGLRVPHPSQVVNGSVLGLGAYFADCVTKSFQYTRMALYKGNEAYVLLCEVALGENPHEVTQATFDKRPTAGYTSRIAYGKYTPESFKNIHNVKVPAGALINSPHTDSGFLYNEYVVYDTRQYRFRYLVKLKVV